MNIAFPAFFILILIIPGFIFLNAYEKVENTTIEKKPFDVSSSLAFFYSLLIHTLLNLLVEPISGLVVKYDLCIKLLVGAKSITESELVLLSEYINWVIAYFSASFILAFLFGKVFQWLMLQLNPYKSSRFAFDTPWYYELKGKLSETENAQFIKVSCLVDSSGGSFLYYGLLVDFYLDKDGQLNRIVLANASRRCINKDEVTDGEQTTTGAGAQQPGAQDRFYRIKGKRLILKYDDIKNINTEYYYINRR